RNRAPFARVRPASFHPANIPRVPRKSRVRSVSGCVVLCCSVSLAQENMDSKTQDNTNQYNRLVLKSGRSPD
ncbi:MAG: hypothetical protein ACR2HP_03565, partial [Ilumatobacteraceae bacterium]